MADIDLPVFSFRANWKEPITERLEFLTDVLSASQGAEQRRSLRQTPRRSFEADFLLTGPERTFWDLFINRVGGQEVVAPLYWETISLSVALTATVSARIDFDTTYTGWTYQGGFLAILMGKTALDYEVVQIASVDATGVNLAAPVVRPWPRGTKLIPLRRAVLEQVGDIVHPTAEVATVSVQLRVNGPNPWTPAVDAAPVYAGMPVFLNEPNWVENLGVQMERKLFKLDTDIGLTYQRDSLGRTFLGQAHRWFLPGRQKLAGFRDLIYRNRGRAGAFWLPTFKADFRLMTAAASSATQIEVANTGYGYVGGPSSGREYIAIRHKSGTILRKVLSVVPGATVKTEKLNLDAPLGLALSPGLVRKISFADAARFDSDDFEIVHYGGADQHHEVNATFRTFKNTRTSPTPISYPIAAAVKNSTPCGNFEGIYMYLDVEVFPVPGISNPKNIYYPGNPTAYLNTPIGHSGLFGNHPSARPISRQRLVAPPNPGYTYGGDRLQFYEDPGEGDYQLRLQFGPSSTWINTAGVKTMCRIVYRRWNEDVFSVAHPKAGSHTLGNAEGWFAVRNIWPDDWYFTF